MRFSMAVRSIPKETGKKLKALLKNARKSPIPRDIEPMLATLVTEPVESKGWLYEMKWDGYRCLGYRYKGNTELCSRNNKSFNEKFYPLRDDMDGWDINVVVDGEIVVVNEKGL